MYQLHPLRRGEAQQPFVRRLSSRLSVVSCAQYKRELCGAQGGIAADTSGFRLAQVGRTYGCLVLRMGLLSPGTSGILEDNTQHPKVYLVAAPSNQAPARRAVGIPPSKCTDRASSCNCSPNEVFTNKLDHRTALFESMSRRYRLISVPVSINHC